MIDDSMAERDGLRQTWSTADLFWCTFHFLQSIWRWLLNSKHGINCDERQSLMNLVRKLVYVKTEAELITEYSNFENHVLVKKYKTFNSYITGYWVPEMNGLFVLGMQCRPCPIMLIFLPIILFFYAA